MYHPNLIDEGRSKMHIRTCIYKKILQKNITTFLNLTHQMHATQKIKKSDPTVAAEITANPIAHVTQLPEVCVC